MQRSGIIVKDEEILGGTPVFRGTRVPLQALLDYLEGGQTLDEFVDDFPTVSRDAAIAALELTKSVLSVDLGERGIDQAHAADLRRRLAQFAEDWDRPEMAAYDELPPR